MKTYFIDMDVTFSARFHIDAENEETARKIAIQQMEREPRFHTRNGALVDVAITDCFEDND